MSKNYYKILFKFLNHISNEYIQNSTKSLCIHSNAWFTLVIGY